MNKIQKSTVRNAGEFIAAKSNFDAGTLTGHWFKDRFIVKSYNVIIAVFGVKKGEVAIAEWYVTDESYTMTTAQHKGIVKRAVDTCYTLATATELEALAYS